MGQRPSTPRRLFSDWLADQPELAGTLELVWRQARASLPADRVDAWLTACRDIAVRLGSTAALAYIRNSPTVAAAAGPDAAAALAAAAADMAARGGTGAVQKLLVAAPAAARRLGSIQGFAEWLRIIGLVAERAPESVALLLERTEKILGSIELRAFEAWALGGIRAAEHDPERRLKFFALLDPKALHGLERGANAVRFADVEREIRAYVTALWRMTPPIRTLPPADLDRPQRPSFDGTIIRLPETFGAARSGEAKMLFRAAVAHILAHLQTRVTFAIGSLKPVQLALVSLIEDARVEQLAIAVYPGLRRLWLPFHRTEAAGAVTATALMARLARALIDPGYVDDNGWVAKGRQLFFADPGAWHDAQTSRAIGGLLGNDLGQMRAPFNAKTYVVEPAYRDDHRGLWDWGAAAGAAAEAEFAYEAVRSDSDAEAVPDRQRAGGEDVPEGALAARARPADAEVEIGMPVARYPEWDFLIARERSDWTTVVEYAPPEAAAQKADERLEARAALVHRITALVRAAKVSRPIRLRRQAEGDGLDLEASIDAAIDRRLGLTPTPRVYTRFERRFRDLSVLLLLDASQSTNDPVPGAGATVLELERDAAALLAHAMSSLGDPFAIHAFCSDTREDVRYYRIKDFEMPYDGAARRRLAGMKGRFSTRMGAALRHAGSDLVRRLSHRRLLLMISDGEPSDVDIADRRYLVEDARRAVMTLQHAGIDVFCVGLHAGGDTYLRRIFGRRNTIELDRVERLPEKLPLLYLRLTA
jgi:hypothetical protein